MFQDFKLLPNKTVFENVAFALEVIGRPSDGITGAGAQVLDPDRLSKKALELPHRAFRRGAAARVVARALANGP